jgi:nucleotide-binding universal stress UspA family protein
MIRTILVGLDGSASSVAAVDLGVRWAIRFNALLVGLGIIDEPAICRPEPTGIWGSSYKQRSDELRLADARCQVDKFLEKFARHCADAGVPCQALEDVGHPYKQILLEAQRFDLILLGHRPRYHFETQERDTDTLRKVLLGGTRPVVVVPEHIPGERSVLVAYDGGPSAVRALQAFQASGLAQGCEVHVLSAAVDLATAEQHVARAIEYLHHHTIEAKACPVVTSAAPARAILDQVRQCGAGLIVMGAYGRSRVREVLFGSLTRTLLRESSVPLFLCH